MTALRYCILFSAMPFWHVTIFSHINVLEIAILINLLFLPFTLAKEDLKLQPLDILVFVYLLWGLISVGVGSNSFYESARTYRYMVLMPTLTYLCFRFGGLTLELFRKGFIFLSFSIFLKSIIALQFYFTYHIRPVGELWKGMPCSFFVGEMISMSFWCCFVACGLAFLRRRLKKGFMVKILLYSSLLTILAALYVSSTRVAIFTFVGIVPILLLAGRQSRWRGYLVMMVYLTIIVMFISISVVPNKTINIQHGSKSGHGRSFARSTSRVMNVDLALRDLQGRLLFWRVIAKKGLERPFVGVGMAAYSIGKRAGTSFYLGSSHNALISAFYTSGIIGLLLLLSLYFVAFSTALKAMKIGSFLDEENIIFFSLFVLLFISITNDLSSGRASILFFILALIARMGIWERLNENTEPFEKLQSEVV